MPRVLLVIDDNAVTRKLVRAALERGSDWQVLEAESAAAGLSVLERERPDVILQDLVLPDRDGFDLSLAIHARPECADIPIIAFSGLLSPGDEARLSKSGFHDVITKPMEPSRLRQILDARIPPRSGTIDRFGAGKRLIVADDDPAQLKLARLRLERYGFETVAAMDGEQVMGALRSGTPCDAVVSDVMMPHMDGFALALAMRQQTAMANVPVLLVTSSYIDAADRALALKAGAADLVLRTPDLSDVVRALRSTLGAPATKHTSSGADLASLERERAVRVLRQLERQAAINSGISQRNAQLTAEVAVLSSISEAIVRGKDVDLVIDEVLASCFDAGAITMGGLYLLRADGGVKTRTLGDFAQLLEGVFTDARELATIAGAGRSVVVDAQTATSAGFRRLFAETRASTALIVPVVHAGEGLGAMVMVAAGKELMREDWKGFAQGLANQLALSLSLGRAVFEKRASEELAREQEAMLRLVIETVPEGVLVADETGRELVANAAAASLLSLRTDEPYETFAADGVTLIPPKMRPMARAIRGEPTESTEVLVRSPSATDRWLAISARPLVSDGRARGGVVVFRDITQKRQADAQLLVSERLASVGMLAAGVAHEINNPLAAVIANLELAVRQIEQLPPALRDEVRAELEDAAAAADRVRTIVRDLRLFARQEETKDAPVDVQKMIESTLRLAWNEIRQRARLVKDFAPVPPAAGNEGKIAQVFLNLVVNAAQAIPAGTPENHRITVSTRPLGSDRIVVDVTDTGSGMSPEIQKRLFQPFFTTKPIGTGTGLGLSICQRIVTSFGGSISVQSEVGKGTTFTVTLRAAKTAPEPKHEVETRAPADPGRRGRVLVIDDEPMIAGVLRRLLRAEHDVTAVECAADALALFEKGERYHVVFCDLMMPGMTGMDLFESLGDRYDNVAARMVFFTGGAFSDRARTFMEKVPNARLEKPFDSAQVKELVSGYFQVFE